MLRISLWWIEGDPPLKQLSACSMVKCWPQTQWEGRYDGVQPYRKHRASLKAPSWKRNPCSEIGKAESQLEAPFSEKKIRTFCRYIFLQIICYSCCVLSVEFSCVEVRFLMFGVVLASICLSDYEWRHQKLHVVEWWLWCQGIWPLRTLLLKLHPSSVLL